MPANQKYVLPLLMIIWQQQVQSSQLANQDQHT